MAEPRNSHSRTYRGGNETGPSPHRLEREMSGRLRRPNTGVEAGWVSDGEDEEDADYSDEDSSSVRLKGELGGDAGEYGEHSMDESDEEMNEPSNDGQCQYYYFRKDKVRLPHMGSSNANK